MTGSSAKWESNSFEISKLSEEAKCNSPFREYLEEGFFFYISLCKCSPEEGSRLKIGEEHISISEGALWTAIRDIVLNEEIL